jgi:hypothetical protein
MTFPSDSDPLENELQQRVIAATLDLLAHTQRPAFRLPIPNTTPQLVVAAGEAATIREILEIESPLAVRLDLDKARGSTRSATAPATPGDDRGGSTQ